MKMRFPILLWLICFGIVLCEPQPIQYLEREFGASNCALLEIKAYHNSSTLNDWPLIGI